MIIYNFFRYYRFAYTSIIFFILFVQINTIESLTFQVEATAFICRPCWQRTERTHRQRIPEVEEQSGREDNPPENPNSRPTSMNLPGLLRAPNTANSCIFQYCLNESRRRVPENIIVHMLCRYSYFLPNSARVCNEHLEQNLWHLLPLQDNTSDEFTAAQIISVVSMLQRRITHNTIDFEEYENMAPGEFQTWTGLRHEQFAELLENLSSLRLLNKRKTILAAALVKLRTGDSNARLANIFKCGETTFHRWLAIGRDALLDDFVPFNLGFDHISREDVARRNLLIPNNLFGNPLSSEEDRKAITICDGTYVYLQKSGNYFFQRQSYSHHKYRNLLKPFLLVSTDGHITEVMGPYSAVTSDADIMNDIVNNEDSPFHWFYRSGDVFILDRGFRDAMENLHSCGYIPHMPETKCPNETQLTTDQANKSRLITICRWVVEVVNGRFKRDFRLLRNIYNNRALRNMFDYFRIAAAISNRFHVLIEDNPHAANILEIINERMHVVNRLAELVERHNYNRRRAQFTPMAADIPEFADFLRISEHELFLFALGVYQLKQAKSYYAEHILNNGSFVIELCNAMPDEHLTELQGTNLWMVRGRIQSRHIRARQYYVYIVIDRSLCGREAIAHHYCTCVIGKRTIGCCSHIMCIIWYMSYARYLSNISLPAFGLDNIIVIPDEYDLLV